MPFLEESDLQELLDARTEEGDITAFVDEAGVIAPMPAIYEQSAAQVARELIAQGRRAIKALGDRVKNLTLRPGNSEHLRNINTPRESKRAIEALGPRELRQFRQAGGSA